MNTETLEIQFREKVCRQVRLEGRGLNRFVVFQPFCFDDGDHFVVVLRKDGPHWMLTDEGHTLMHVQYDDLDLSSKTRATILENTLSAYCVTNRGGELQLVVPGEQFGDSLYSFLRALNKISDLNFLQREKVRSAFMDEVRSLMENLVPPERRVFDYYEKDRDPDGNYQVDLRINGKKRPELIFFLPNNDHCRDATIVCHQFERWNIPFRATGIFEDQTQIGRRVVAQFSDVAHKQIPSLGSKDRIEKYFREEVLTGE